MGNRPDSVNSQVGISIYFNTKSNFFQQFVGWYIGYFDPSSLYIKFIDTE